MPLKEIIAGAEADNLRIDQFFLRAFPALSRSRCREFLASGLVLVNGRRARKGTRVRAGDRVAFDEAVVESFFADFAPPASPAPVPPPVLYRDDALVAVDKPPGIDCAPLKAADTGTLLSAVVALEPRLSRVVGWRQRESGLVYRIDRDVSGVVLFAVTRESFLALASASRKDEIGKTYLAVVENLPGRKLDRAGTISASDPQPRGRSRRVAFRKLAYHPGRSLEEVRTKLRGGAGGRRTYLAQVEPLRHAGRLTLVRVRITRAFRHQIRSFLAELGHPVVGDGMYGSRAEEGTGVMLHCWKVKCPHPASGKTLDIESRPERIVRFAEAFSGPEVLR